VSELLYPPPGGAAAPPSPLAGTRRTSATALRSLGARPRLKEQSEAEIVINQNIKIDSLIPARAVQTLINSAMSS